MKHFLVTLVIMTAPAFGIAQRQTSGAQAFFNYSIVIKDLSQNQSQECAKSICAFVKSQANIECKYLAFIGVITAVMTPESANRLAQHQCVSAIEMGREVHAAPSVGRRN